MIVMSFRKFCCTRLYNPIIKHHTRVLQHSKHIELQGVVPRRYLSEGIHTHSKYKTTIYRCLLPRQPGSCVRERTFPNRCLYVRCFHTSTPRKALNPLLLIVGRIATVVLGRQSGRWFRRQPKEFRQKYGKIAIGCTAGLVASGVAFLIKHYYDNLQETPITHRQRFITFTPEQFEYYANFEAETYREESADKILPNTHPYYVPLVNIATKILKANRDIPELKDVKWNIFVVDSEDVNAIVFPNGYVFFNTGAMKFVENEDQLAFIFGHEMSHALLSHGAENMSQSNLINLVLTFVLTAIWTLIPIDGIALITHWFLNRTKTVMVDLPYSRELEAEADEVGIYLIAKACYDVREGSVFWSRMAMNRDLSGSKNSEFLSTHPSNEKRVANIQALLPKAFEMRDLCKCPPLPAIDPRNFIQKQQKQVQNVVAAKKARVNLKSVTRVAGALQPLTDNSPSGMGLVHNTDSKPESSGIKLVQNIDSKPKPSGMELVQNIDSKPKPSGMELVHNIDNKLETYVQGQESSQHKMEDRIVVPQTDSKFIQPAKNQVTLQQSESVRPSSSKGVNTQETKVPVEQILTQNKTSPTDKAPVSPI